MILAILFILSGNCHTSGGVGHPISYSRNINEDTTYLGKITTRVFNLKEVKKRSEISSLNIDCRLSPIKGYDIWVQVGHMEDTKLKVYFNFLVKKEDLEIFYYNTYSNKILSLKEWRKRQD